MRPLCSNVALLFAPPPRFNTVETDSLSYNSLDEAIAATPQLQPLLAEFS